MSRSIHPLLLTLAACACAGRVDSGAHLPPAAPPLEAATAVVPLKHADATELVSIFDELNEASSRALAGRWAGVSCAFPQLGMESEMWRELREPPTPTVRVRADPRTNSLILTGQYVTDLARVLELVATLDEDASRPR